MCPSSGGDRRALQTAFVAILCALDRFGQGANLAEALAAEGLNSKAIGRARRLNWRRQIDPLMFTGMAIEAHRSAAERAAAINPTLKKCIGYCAHWRMPRPILIGPGPCTRRRDRRKH